MSMFSCKKEQSWVAYYKENMKTLGVPVPEGWFLTMKSVELDIGLILAAIKLLGKNATIGEIIGATVGLEKLAVSSAVIASSYLGAMVGSAGVATSRVASCGVELSDVMLDLHNNGIYIPGWLYSHLQAHPELYGKGTLAAARAYITKTKR